MAGGADRCAAPPGSDRLPTGRQRGLPAPLAASTPHRIRPVGVRPRRDESHEITWYRCVVWLIRLLNFGACARLAGDAIKGWVGRRHGESAPADRARPD